MDTIDVRWDPAMTHVVHYYFHQHWSWDDFMQAFQQELELGKSVTPQRYDVIGNFLDGYVLPKGSGVSHVYRVFRLYPKNWGVTLVVTNNAFIRAMVRILTTVHPDTRGRFLTAESLDEAYALLREHRREHADINIK